MNMVLGEAMRGRQLPQVAPHEANMGCPQFGQKTSSVGASNEFRPSLGAELSTWLQPRAAAGCLRGEDPPLPEVCEESPFLDLSNTGSSPVGDDRFAGDDGQTPIVKV